MKVFKDSRFSESCGSRVAYGFYGRSGGVSEGLYASLNCAPGTNDIPENVAKNRSIVATHLGAVDGMVSTLWQCHSAACYAIKSHAPVGDERAKGDALVTDVAGLAIGVLTADCGPVLFVGAKPDGSPVIGAAHAGWGGALKGILEDTVAKMVQIGASIETIKACLGPCIAQGSYEVQDAFAAPFVAEHDAADRFFMAARKEGHLMFDLSGYIAFRLAHAGVRHVSLMGVDTYVEDENCFSYRRSTHRKEPDYGRQLSAIMING